MTKRIERQVLAARVAKHRDIFKSTFRQISKAMLIPLSTVHRWYVSRPRPREGLVARVKECLAEVTRTSVCRTLDDVRKALAKKGLSTSTSTISRAAKGVFSKRKVYPFKPVNHGNEELRQTFSGFVRNNPSLWDDLVSVDECAVYLNCNRQLAWYRRGPKLRVRDGNNASRVKVSLILAVHPTHGIIHHRAICGSYNKVEFATFLRELHTHLPACLQNPHLVMDNVSFHKSKEIVTLYEKFNMKAIYVPPYTSEWNPVERVFHMVKSKFRSTITAQLLEDRGTTLRTLADIIAAVHDNQRHCISNIYAHVKTLVMDMRPLGSTPVIIG